MDEQATTPAEEKKDETPVAGTQQERVLRFGKLPKFDVENMWRCDVLTGEVISVKLNKTYDTEDRGTTKNGKKILVRVKTYWIMTKSNYFYLPAETQEEAVKKFEEEFARAETQIKTIEEQRAKQKEESCLKKV